MNNLRNVIGQLKSDKVKERQQGVIALRQAFERDGVVEHLDEVGDGRAWLVVFQALFTAVVTERTATVKKDKDRAHALTLRRLEDLTSAVRWLTERSVSRLNKKVVNALLKHLLQAISHKGALFQPVALDYAKTLRAILSYQPHLEHLDNAQWVEIASVAFAVVLGDDLNTSLDDEESSDEESEADVSSSLSEGDRNPSKKRRRQESIGAGPSKKARTSPRSVSLEQIEFVSVIAILLKSPYAPLVSKETPIVGRRILTRFGRFFQLYTTDTSAHVDAIFSLNITLQQLALNARHDVSEFGVSTWDSLLALWTTKNRQVKEGVLAVLVTLLPYVSTTDIPFDHPEKLGKLLKLLLSERESRWGFDPLSLDSIRLSVENISSNETFVARTFRHGFNFDSSQALAWVTLELIADCAKELYVLSESPHQSSNTPNALETKRGKLENPITTLLRLIQTQNSAESRVSCLQSLLFIIDRHWPSLHVEIRQEIYDGLIRLVSVDNPPVQSWAFCCFAAITHEDQESQLDWDAVWRHAMRRTGVPLVCRAACHAANTLLLCSKLPLQRISPEMESLASDISVSISVQGPTYPFDSVCALLSQCIMIASRDVGLYELQLGEKVLGWLADNWVPFESSVRLVPGTGKNKMEQRTAADILGLLETASGLKVRSDLVSAVPLPDHLIVSLVEEHNSSRVIRRFLLGAQLESGQSLSTPTKAKAPTRSPIPNAVTESVAPVGRERKASSLLLKAVEGSLAYWESRAEANSTTSLPAVETLRRSLDLAILCICFEASLTSNGIRSTRRVLTAACKLLLVLGPYIGNTTWTGDEAVLLTSTLLQITLDEPIKGRLPSWAGFIDASTSTGIRRSAKEGTNGTIQEDLAKTGRNARRTFLRTLWSYPELQESLSPVFDAMRKSTQRYASSHKPSQTSPRKGNNVDVDNDKDDFAPIRTGAGSSTPVPSSRVTNAQNSEERVISMYLDILLMSQLLQSSEGELLRDKTTIDIVCDCNHVQLHVLLVPFLKHIQEKNIHFGISSLEKLMDNIGQALTKYDFSRSELMQTLALRVLDSSLHLWSQMTTEESRVPGMVGDLLSWLVNSFRRGKILNWLVRDLLVRLLDKYIQSDPHMKFWSSIENEDVASTPPDEVLFEGNEDQDIRIRFSSAIACSRLFLGSYMRERDPMDTYQRIRDKLCLSLDDYEFMLSRFVCLGNIVLSSSAVRRGPLWHLLETCLHTSSYTNHVGNVIKNVARLSGFPRTADMFEAYASQIAYSIQQSSQDFFQFPPHVLGYPDRKSYAEATFVMFSPSNLLSGGQELFERHCRVISIDVKEGLRRCFCDVVGYRIALWFADNHNSQSEGDVGDGAADKSDPLFRLICHDLRLLGDEDELLALMGENVDEISAAIIRTIGDMDTDRDGPNVQALQAFESSDRMVRAYRALNKFRGLCSFEVHIPNMPFFPTFNTLQALSWLTRYTPLAASAPTTYHVLHRFLKDIASSWLVNEQLRLFNCLCVFISRSYSHFKNATILQTLMNGAVTMLEQPELAPCAQGLLDWAFIHLREVQCAPHRVIDVLIRSCLTARMYLDAAPSSLRGLGQQMMDWLNQQLLVLAQAETTKKQVRDALTAWPVEVSEPLSDIISDMTCTEISSILANTRVSSHKFKAVKMLSELAKDSDSYSPEQFLKHDFWALKECIPAGHLKEYDIDAFIDLLLAHSGHLSTSSVNQQYLHSVATRHQRLYQSRDDKSKRIVRASPKRPILMALMDMLGDANINTVWVAYCALRRIAGTISLDSPDLGSWPSEYRGEVAFLKVHPSRCHVRPSKTLNDLHRPEYLLLGRDYKEWIRSLTILFCDILSTEDAFFSHLTPVLGQCQVFGEQVFPVLVHALLQNDTSGKLGTRKELSLYLTRLLDQDGTDIACIRCTVQTVLHLRYFMPDSPRSPLDYNVWLDIDYHLLSRCATTCGAYTTALLFLELTFEYRSQEQVDDTTTELILSSIYNRIDEPDGFYGIKSKDLSQFLLKRFRHENQWNKAFQFYGAGHEAGDASAGGAIGILESLHSFGFNKLAMSTLQTFTTTHASGMSYKLGWRTETWDLPDVVDDEDQEMSLYNALKAIHRERDSTAANHIVHLSLSKELRRLKELGTEDFRGIRQVIKNLMCLAQIRHWKSEPIQESLAERSMQQNDAWSTFCEVYPDIDFEILESILATRVCLVHSVQKREQREQIGTMVSAFSRSLLDLEKKCLVQTASAAQSARRVQLALNAVVRARQIEESPSFAVSREFAEVLWLQGEKKLATEYLQSEMQRDGQAYVQKGPRETLEKALYLARLGEWLNEASLQKPDDIRTTFFTPAVEKLQSLQGTIDPSQAAFTTDFNSKRSMVFYKYAMFAEQQYHAILNSPDVLRLKVYAERKRQELQQYDEKIRRSQSDLSRNELTQQKRKAQVLYEQDTSQFLEVTTARDTYLQHSIDMFARCLEASDDYDDDAPYHLCSLWFSNFTNDLGTTVNTSVARVASRKFVFLAHQLSARLSSNSNLALYSQSTLQGLLIRMCSEHPFHSMYQVYSLRSSQRRDSSRRQSNRHGHETSSQLERTAAANDIFDKLRAMPERESTVRNIEHLCDAYLEWAKFPIKNDSLLSEKRRKKEQTQIPQQLLISKVQNVQVPVITAKTPLDPTLRYKDCVWIQRYSRNFDTAGGMNLPKISYCHGSDGQVYKQLFKGEGDDDLRQDAVMEQVFELCNQVLHRDTATRRRGLCIRTYKVVPLAPQAGLLEFVNNTVPMHNWLTRAHDLYRPSDMQHRAAHGLLTQTRTKSRGDKHALIEAFKKIRQHFKPVLRHFFTERHKLPLAWFETRLNYSRSVATTSIIGHVLGLGDRHISNILLDHGSGEVVHIDLGIAFEQGKLLPIPERVPFRLTADMVDGFGISGTEGVFRRCAEETIRVLRDGSDVIRTVLDVFKYDPLHSWTASPVKVQRAQPDANQAIADTDRNGIGIDMHSGSEDEAADRALSGVARKLDKVLSVEYTVNELINEATDISNLALMFAGWSPHC